MENKLRPGVYVHLPFCSVHCVYCDFPITTRLALSERYYRALLMEMHCNPPSEVVDTLYFGGGTPSLAPIEVLKEIISMTPLVPGSEITLEANPDHLTEELLLQWREIGINRLSLGVQSLEDRVLSLMLRQHTSQEALLSVRRARNAGFSNVNVDLILGFPEQTVTGFLDGLKAVLELHPNHFSIYMLEVHGKTPLHQWIQDGKMSPMNEEEQIHCYDSGISLLEAAGYQHYEVSNFALRNETSFHNMKYWQDAPYFAYGAGACSYYNSKRTRNLPDVAAYIAALEAGEPVAEETILEDEETRVRNALIFGLRKIQGVHISEFETNYGRNPFSLFGSEMETYLAGGFLEISRDHLRLTRKGMLLSNEILSAAIG